jgi:hypothetical protein
MPKLAISMKVIPNAIALPCVFPDSQSRTILLKVFMFQVEFPTCSRVFYHFINPRRVTFSKHHVTLATQLPPAPWAFDFDFCFAEKKRDGSKMTNDMFREGVELLRPKNAKMCNVRHSSPQQSILENPAHLFKLFRSNQ